jgi:thiol-disulfide isomerase/thioredoxin
MFRTNRARVSLTVILALTGGVHVCQAQNGAEPVKVAPPAPAASAADAGKLNIGDPAPALSIEHWVKGEPVKSFEKGKVYVVEFWATWCGPCIKNMPHLTKLQKQHKDKGLTIIGVSGQDKRGVEDVRPFVEKKGDAIGYTIAVDRAMETTKAYMGATGRNGIPVAYLVDQQGKLAWYGHPMEAMDLVIEEVLEGKFDASRHAERMAKFKTLSEQFGKATQEKRWDDAMTALDEMKTVRPDLANDFAISRFAVLRAGKKDKEAAAKVRVQLEEQFKDDVDNLRKLSEMLAGVPEPDAADLAAATAVAKTIVTKTDGNDVQALAVLAYVYRNAGDWDNALATQQKAIDKSADEGTRANMKAILDQMNADRAEASKPAQDEPAADAPKGDAPKNP